jgi:hypothetical protein
MTRCGARWRGLAISGVVLGEGLLQGSKGRKGSRDKGRYGSVVAGYCFALLFLASFLTSLLATPSGIGGFLGLSGMAAIKGARIR